VPIKKGVNKAKKEAVASGIVLDLNSWVDCF